MSQNCMKTQRKPLFLQGTLLLITFLLLAGSSIAQVCPFTVNLSSITPATCNGANGSIRITAPTGGQSPYTYSWNTVPVRTSQNLLSVAPGTYTLKVTDRRGCVVTRVWTITNTPDTEAPMIMCNATPITVSTEPGICGAFINFQDNVPIDYRMNTGSGATEAGSQRGPFAGGEAPSRDVLKPLVADNCTAVTLSGVRLDGQPLSAVYPLGNTSILWTAVDAAGNMAQCTQVYTVIDNEYPVITGVPADITLDATSQDCGRIVTWTVPTASDNCSASFGTNWAPGSYFNVGTQTVTYTATDPSGNSTARSFTVTIRDVERPIILTCAPDITVPAGPDCQASPVLLMPVATDNCPSSQLTFSNDAPPVFPIGTTVVTWTVRDSSGNSVTCQQRVTVADRVAPVPVLAALPDVTAVCSASVTPPTASDCSGTITATTADATTYTTQGTHIVHWTYTDASGNSFLQLQNVILRDEEPPTIECPASITVVANAPCGRSLDPGTATGTDNCTVTISGVRNDGLGLGDCYPVGTTTITWTAVDGAGNRATCEQKITVTSVSISGTVYNDADGGVMNGTPVSNADGQLYVNLVNTATNTVVASKQLTDGTFTFRSADGLDAAITSYALVLASSATATSSELPDAAGWVNTAEGAAASSGDGSANGTFSFSAAVVDGQVSDFAIEARPVPATLLEAPSLVNPGGTLGIAISPALFSATDTRDLNGAGEVRYVHILSFPSNSNSVTFTAAADAPGAAASAATYTASTFPAGGVYVATNLSGNPLAGISADPVDGGVTIDFIYKAVDQARVESNNTGIARQPLTDLWIAGTVYNDVDALKNGVIDGSPVATSNGQPLYVNLMNASNGSVVASKQVDANGKYRFTSADGLCINVSEYRLVLTTAPSYNWPALPNPAGWWNTGAGNANGNGNGNGNGPNPLGTGNGNNGIFNFGAPVSNGQIVDFGIEARPVPTPLTVAPSQVNPGNTSTVSIAASLFSASDAVDVAGGEVRFLHIVSFPTNTQTV
ncbi:MAG: HYR domain-containing protein, partial [Sphingobacteriales bacterium]